MLAAFHPVIDRVDKDEISQEIRINLFLQNY